MLGITTRAPRSLSNRHQVVQRCALPAPAGGRSLHSLDHLSMWRTIPILHQLSCRILHQIARAPTLIDFRLEFRVLILGIQKPG